MLILHHTDCTLLFQLSPVNTTVGRFSATDLDGQRLYYTLTSESVRLIFFCLSVGLTFI